ncbi:hypothetical protein DERP_010824 [Dermatophagoides pteronyssinus]|uniref:Uncharacterized protein n=1 Tax=Dermatophagoides pteronyssinus TaxID=6956 RepID=A0ABQ8J7E0_DERPT|nr:hypothetical protein DERP_010824 [Dermatophagoides pteronyssinus]
MVAMLFNAALRTCNEGDFFAKSMINPNTFRGELIASNHSVVDVSRLPRISANPLIAVRVELVA